MTTIAIDPDDIPRLEGTPLPEIVKIPPFITPIEEDLLPNHTGHDGGLNDIKIWNHTGGEQIVVKDWRDFILTADKPYEPNKGQVGNMGEFLGQPGFDTDVKKNSTKTKQQYGGQSIYEANGRKEGTDIKKLDYKMGLILH